MIFESKLDCILVAMARANEIAYSELVKTQFEHEETLAIRLVIQLVWQSGKHKPLTQYLALFSGYLILYLLISSVLIVNRRRRILLNQTAVAWKYIYYVSVVNLNISWKVSIDSFTFTP